MNGNQNDNGASAKRRLPRLNFRPLVFCALGLCMGIFIYMRARFGGLAPSDFLLFGGLFAVALFPLSWRRAACIFACVLLFAGVGAGFSHLYTERYLSGEEEGTYEVRGTVSEFALYNGYTEAVLTGVTLDGVPCAGKLRASVGADVVAGDTVCFTAPVRRAGAPTLDDFYDFTEDIRYYSSAGSAEHTGRGGDLLLQLNGVLYRSLTENMPEEEAELSYALLTGNSRAMDTGVLRSVRRGGIAHIFAVSGMHIGILYGAAVLICRPLKRWASLPAVALAFCYTAMCGFSVSALRAAIMCTVHAVGVLLHRKTDFLNTIAFAAIAVLLIFPAQWLSAGFRLSFGACLGLALFAGALKRGMQRLRCPAPVAAFFSASISVQIFTFPILFESFGYFSVWGLLLNLVLVPLLPVFFLGILLPALLALIIPPAAAVFLAVPGGLTAALLAVLSRLDLSLVVTGFSLGGGGTVWLAAALALSERFRAGMRLRLTAAGCLCVLFSLLVVLRNVVFSGCVVRVRGSGDAVFALIRSPQGSVFLLDAEASLSDCQDFLTRNLTGAPDVAVVIAENAMRAVNTAAFLGAGTVYAAEQLSTGLHETPVSFVREFALGDMFFRFESAQKLVLFAEDVVVEFDFENNAVLSADFAVEKGVTDLNFSLRRGIIGML